MFEPIERRNRAGDVVQRLRVAETDAGLVSLMVEDGGSSAFIDLDGRALDEAITQLSVIRTNRRIAREVADAARKAAAERQEQRFASAMQSGF